MEYEGERQMKLDIEKVRGTYDIFANGDDVVLTGDRFRLFTPEGRETACRRDIRNACKAVFLPERRALVRRRNGMFHLIDLRDGSEFWTVPGPKPVLYNSPVVMTPDYRCAYTYDSVEGRLQIIRLDLEARETDSFSVYYDMGATRDILCDEEGIPCVLKTYFEQIGNQIYCQNGVRIQDYDILYRGSTFFWKWKWQFTQKDYASRCFLGQLGKILTTDLHVYWPDTGEMENLLENESQWQQPAGGPMEGWIDQTGRYLCLMYEKGNVVIDMEEKHVAAQYRAEYARGCLVGNQYWICRDKQIVRLPFPDFEPWPEDHFPNLEGIYALW